LYDKECREFKDRNKKAQPWSKIHDLQVVAPPRGRKNHLAFFCLGLRTRP
jgi:hypothetical protein